MAVKQKKFRSEQGFESPNFEVGTNGRITTRVLDVNQILLNGVPFVGQDPDEPTDPGEGDGGTDPTNPFDNITSLTVNGQLRVNNTIDEVSTRILTIQNGAVTLNNVETGSIENVNIGMSTPGQAKFYSIDLVSAPDSTAAILEADGATFSGNITFDGNLSITAAPVNGTDITNKDYVDSTSIAFSVALGV
jgi:hypothetical protein